jgi:protein TonB
VEAPAEPAPEIVPVTLVEPVYPARARRRRIEGRVEVEITVDGAGAVREVRILEAKPRGVFEPAVRKAVRQWRFQAPPDGRMVRLRETIHFRLER